MAENELLNKLNKIHESKTQKEIENSFNTVAEEIFNKCVLVVNNKEKEIKYRITEIEFYYYNKCNNKHIDPYVHCNEIQEEFGKWYFHRTSKKKLSKLKQKTRKGLDITFGNNSSCGGILIRAIEKYDDPNEYIKGPCKVVNQILEEFSINEDKYNKFVEEIEKSGIFEKGELYLESNKLEKKSYYKAPRVGLYPDSDKLCWKKFIMKPYRYLTFLDDYSKEKFIFTLILLTEEHNKKILRQEIISDRQKINYIIKDFSCDRSTIRKYIEQYEDIKEKNNKKDLLYNCINNLSNKKTSYEKSKLYGLLNEGVQK